MAVNFDEFRLPPEDTGGTDPVAGNGAALHSRLLHDGPRSLNNLAARVEPCYSFAMSAGAGLTHGGRPNPWYFRATTDYPAAGLAFLWQSPILLPHQAKRLLWTHSIQRGNVGSEVGTTVTVSALKLYLAANPFSAPLVNYPTGIAAHPNECVGTVLEDSDVDKASNGAFISHEVPIVGLSGGTYHKLVEDVVDGWTEFMRGGHVATSFGAPTSHLIVCARFSGAVVDDYIMAHEWASWGGYE